MVRSPEESSDSRSTVEMSRVGIPKAPRQVKWGDSPRRERVPMPDSVPLCWGTLAYLVTHPEARPLTTRREAHVQEDLTTNGPIMPSISGLTVNRYPYNLETGIGHYVFWCDDWEVGHNEVARLVPPGVPCLSYTNPTGQRSQPHRPHRHVFVLSGTTIPRVRHHFGSCERGSYQLPSGGSSREDPQDYFWTGTAIRWLWDGPVLRRWRPHLQLLVGRERSHLERMGVLLYFGGIVGSLTEVELAPVRSQVVYRGPRDVDLPRVTEDHHEWTSPRGYGCGLACVPFSSYIYSYLDFLTGQGDYSTPSGPSTTTNYHVHLKPWERVALVSVE